MKGNFKAKCISAYGEGFFTVGKIYEVKNGKVAYDSRGVARLAIDDIDALNSCMVSQFVLINENQSIHIYRKDSEVIATLKSGKQTVKTAKAKCNPSDEFDFNVGAKLAFQRLMGEEVKPSVKEVKRPAKVGEWIKVVVEENSDRHNKGKNYSRGDVVLVNDFGSLPSHTEIDRLGIYTEITGFHPYEYVVLENYQPEDNPEQKEKTLSDYSAEELLTEIKRRINHER